MRAWMLVLVAAGLGGCAGEVHQSGTPTMGGDVDGMAPPLMGANEMHPEPGLFTGPTGEATLFGGNFPETAEDGALEPKGRGAGSPYRFSY